MSFGDLEYQETTSSTLARLLKSMRQEQIILDAVQNPIDDIEEYPDARQVESIKGTKDQIGASIVQYGSTWQLPSEPNENTRLWAWFREGWRVYDHSLHGNNIFAQQVEPSPQQVCHYVPLKRKVNDDGTTDGRYYGIIDGVSQYYRVEDGPENRFSDLLITKNEICFSIFLSPWKAYAFDSNNRMNLFSKLDNDQITNAIKVEVTEDGAVYFKVIYQGSNYEIHTADETIPITELAEFLAGEFVEGEFLTQSSKEWQYNADVNPPDWTWLFFSFNKNTRILKIYKVSAGFVATEIATSTLDETGYRSTISMHLPMNEGGVDALGFYDIVNSNNATFGAAPNNDPTWNGFIARLDTNTAHAVIPNHASINTLSVFTIAFKARLQSYAATSNEDIFVSKGYGGNADQATGASDFKIHLLPSGSSTLRVTFQADAGGITKTINKTSAFPSLNTWVNVILTYDGTTYSLEIDNTTPVTLADSSNVFTSSEDWYVGDTVNAAQCDIAHFIIDKGTAWGSTQKSWFKNVLVPGQKALSLEWKPPKPPEPEEPLPVVRPMELVYEKVVPETGDVIKLNALQLTTEFLSTYNVAGGTPVTVTEELKYDCPDGTVGGSSTTPVTTIYNLAAASSTGNIQDTERAYVQRIDASTSDLFGKNPTDMQFWVDSDDNADGTVYVGIIRNDGSYTKFGTGMAASTLGGGWVSISGTSFVARANLAIGDGVGVIREGHTDGTVFVRRGGTDNHADTDGSGNPLSWQHLRTLSAWGSDNDQYSIAGVVKDGGITTAGANPFYKMGSTNWVIGEYQLNSTIEGIVPTRVIFRVRRVGSAASATLKCYILTSTGTSLATFDVAKSFNSISTSVQDLEFINRDNTIPWQDTYMVALAFDVKTGIDNTTNYLEVNYNVGPGGAGIVGGTALKARVFNGVNAYVDLSPVADWAGKVYVGGASFSSYIELDNLTTRAGEKVAQWLTPNISTLYNELVSKWNVILKKSGSPTGNISVKLYDGSGGFITTLDTVIDASTLTTSDATYTFQKPGQNYPLGENYRIVVQYENGTTTDKVLVKCNTDAAAGANGDGVKSILTKFTSAAWVDIPTQDISGEMFTGGIPDSTSRPKLSIVCGSIFSLIYKDKITKFVSKFKKLGAPTGTVFIRSMRGSDNSPRDLIGSFDISTLSTSTWESRTLTNFNAVHFMGETDKIVIEYNGGDASNALLVLVDKASTYDDEDTHFAEWNGLSWLNEDQPWDLHAELWKGGDTYIPDAGTPYVEPPDFYDHDLIIGAGSYIKNEFYSFYGMRVRDFRLETNTPNLEEMDNLFDNKYSRKGGASEVALVGWFGLNSETEPPA